MTKTLQRNFHVATLVALVTVACRAQPVTEPVAGSQAPALHIDRVLQAPRGTALDWSALAGRVVVLDFWATWCEPCVRLIPHMNRLEERFKGQPIVFVHITNEPENVVRKFLERTQHGGWIGLDSDGATWKAYGIRSLPTTVLVDPAGKVAGWAAPTILVDHPEILQDLLNGKLHSFVSPTAHAETALPEARAADSADAPGDGGDPPMCMITIRRTLGLPPRLLPRDSRRIRVENVTARVAIGQVHGVPPPFVVDEAALPGETRYDVLFQWSGPDPTRGRSILTEAVAASFGVTVRREKRDLDVLVLSCVEQVCPRWEEGPLRIRYDAASGLTAPNDDLMERQKHGEKFYWTTGGTEELAAQLSELIDRPVVDGARVSGYFLFCLPGTIDPTNSEHVGEALKSKYGLTLAAARRTVDVLVVRKPGPERGQGQSD